MRPPSHHNNTYEEYLRFVHAAPTRHEFINGDIIAMAGGSHDHAAIAMNIGGALNVQLRDRPCRVYSSDLKVRIDAVNVATYPDVSIVCGPPELDPRDGNGNTILNPVLVVEVLSPSTAAYDCNAKLEYYKQIPSLREVMLVDHAEPRVMVWRKGFGNAWWPEETRDGVITLASLDCTLTLAEVYRDPFKLPA